MATLALLRPGFPVSKVAKALSDSPHPAVAVVHKSFGNRYQNLSNVINNLLSDPVSAPSCITVVLYVECGPCRFPRRPMGYFPLISGQDSIATFNRKLEQGNERLLKKILSELSFIKERLVYAPEVHYILMPGLEDNFSDKGYEIFRSLIAQTFQEKEKVKIGRNRLQKQARPHRVDEFHSYKLSDLKELSPGDILNGDGEIMCFAGEAGCKGVPESELSNIIEQAQKLDIGFFLWRPEWQGLPANANVNNPIVLPPWQRTYQIPYVSKIKRLLRR